MEPRPLDDDEVVLRRIPSAANWFQPPDRMTSANFKLGRDELGLSVYRAGIVGPENLLSRPETLPGSGVASASVRTIRSLADGNGRPLGLDVVAVDDEDNPGHAEIRGPIPGRLSNSTSSRLRDAFLWMIRPSGSIPSE